MESPNISKGELLSFLALGAISLVLYALSSII